MPHLKQGPKPGPPSLYAFCVGCAVGRGTDCGFCRATAVHPGGSSAVMFAAMEHLVSTSGTVAVVSEIGGAAFASTSAFDSSAVA
jgi:hypothetical protein